MADQNLDIKIKIDTQGGPQAKAEIEQIAKAQKDLTGEQSKAAPVIQQTTQETAKATEAQKEDTLQTEKGTAAKKSQSDVLRGLGTAFPQLTQMLRAAASGAGLFTAGIAAVVKIGVSWLQEMAAQRAAAAALAREIEKLGGSLTSTQEIMAREEAITEAFVAGMKKREESVKALLTQMQLVTAEGLRTEAQNKKVDDEILRGEMLRIDEMDAPESEKNLLRRKATSDAKLRGEKNRIEGIAKGSREDFTNASKFEALQKDLIGQAAGEDPNIAAAQRNFEIADQEQKKAATFIAAQKTEIEAQLKWIRQGMKQSGGTIRNGYLWTPERLKKEEQYYLDKEKGLEGIDKTPNADFETAKTGLDAAKAKKQAILDQAKAADAEARRLMDSGRARRGEYESEIRSFGDREPSIRSMDDRENRNLYKKEWQREQERQQKSPGTGGGTGGGGGGGFGGGDFGMSGDMGELRSTANETLGETVQALRSCIETFNQHGRAIASLKEDIEHVRNSSRYLTG